MGLTILFKCCTSALINFKYTIAYTNISQINTTLPKQHNNYGVAAVISVIPALASYVNVKVYVAGVFSIAPQPNLT